MTLVVNIKHLCGRKTGRMGRCISLVASDVCYYFDYTSAHPDEACVPMKQHMLFDVMRITMTTSVGGWRHLPPVRYRLSQEHARKALDVLWEKRQRGSDLVGTVINIHSGDWVRRGEAHRTHVNMCSTW